MVLKWLGVFVAGGVRGEDRECFQVLALEMDARFRC